MDETKKLIPFGEISESFTGLKDEGVYYVDKTGFIPFLIEQKREICVFTRPRRFGKTLMLRTLQTFFEYRLDDEGKPIDNRRYFEGLKVLDAGEDVLKHLGQYPVISLSFKDIKADTADMVVAQLRGAVRRACEPLEILLKKSGVLSDGQLKTLQGYLDRTVTEDDLMQFLEIIMDWIYKSTKRKTVILIDEYDVPLQQAAIYDMHHPGTDLFGTTVKLVGNFISSGFKSNNNLAYGIIAGCMRVAKESIFTGMNNPGVIDVTSKLPDEYWGFTEAEVKQMLAYYNIGDQYQEIEQWYDGYNFGGRKVFNPWSLLNAIRGLVNGEGEDAIQPYWVMTSGNDIIDDVIERNPQHRELLAKLMSGETIQTLVYKNISYRDLKRNPDAIWSFLLYTGYLKAIKLYKNEDDILEAEVTVPNTEVKTVMRSSLQHWWKNIHLASYDAHALIQALWSGDIAVIEREICGIMDDSISVNDAKEDFYHGMMVGVLRTLCTVKSNRECGEGRPDIVVKDGHRAIILELKCLAPSLLKNMPLAEQFVKVPVMMSKLLDEAETQIKARYYIEGLMFEEQNITEVKAYSVCFCRKKCRVRLVGE
ncbi:MAG: AAA family ATPase [Proteobacteria bacterium]|nr:AAA family ATPase [Pseudomonadota bacterium]